MIVLNVALPSMTHAVHSHWPLLCPLCALEPPAEWLHAEKLSIFCHNKHIYSMLLFGLTCCQRAFWTHSPNACRWFSFNQKNTLLKGVHSEFKHTRRKHQKSLKFEHRSVNLESRWSKCKLWYFHANHCKPDPKLNPRCVSDTMHKLNWQLLICCIFIPGGNAIEKCPFRLTFRTNECQASCQKQRRSNCRIRLWHLFRLQRNVHICIKYFNMILCRWLLFAVNFAFTRSTKLKILCRFKATYASILLPYTSFYTSFFTLNQWNEPISLSHRIWTIFTKMTHIVSPFLLVSNENLFCFAFDLIYESKCSIIYANC